MDPSWIARHYRNFQCSLHEASEIQMTFRKCCASWDVAPVEKGGGIAKGLVHN